MSNNTYCSCDANAGVHRIDDVNIPRHRQTNVSMEKPVLYNNTLLSRSESNRTVCDSNSVTDSTDAHPFSSEQSSDYDIGDTNLCSECIVCQSAPVMYVILPCRHACTCSRCFKKLDKCPMCRGPVVSYFRLKHSAQDDVEEDVSEHQARNIPNEHWLYRLNRRMNQYLGFTD